jgi:hypothetical protein
MVNSKFKAYQKIEVEVGLYYFGAQVKMTDGSFFKHGDMFEGGFFFLTTAYSEELNDLQFIFVRQSHGSKSVRKLTISVAITLTLEVFNSSIIVTYT